MISLSRLRLRAIRVVALTLSFILLAEGCTPTADGAGVDKKALKRQRKAAAGGGAPAKKKGRSLRGTVGNRVKLDSALDKPFADRQGYIVRGTDILMFHPCGDNQSYFVVAGGAAMQRIAQRYKFSASAPYVPMYVTLQVRFMEDSVSSGEFVFTRIADVNDVVQEDGSPKACRPPSRAQIVADSRGQ
jgi:hypothetical protein